MEGSWGSAPRSRDRTAFLPLQGIPAMDLMDEQACTSEEWKLVSADLTLSRDSAQAVLYLYPPQTHS